MISFVMSPGGRIGYTTTTTTSTATTSSSSIKRI